MTVTKKKIVIFLVPAFVMIAYAVVYFASSEVSIEVIEPEGFDWATRQFNHEWQVKFFKPMLGLESAWRDGDFSWSAPRAR